MSKSPTPETDAMIEDARGKLNYPVNPVSGEFARKLERERNQLRDRLFPRCLQSIAAMPSGEVGSIYANDAKALCAHIDELRTKLEDALSDKVIAEAQIAALQDKALAEVGENATIQRLRGGIVKLNADYLRVMVERDNLRASIGVVESWMPKPPANLREDIIRAINCRSAENGSNTPDWILGDFLMASLEAFDAATNDRTMYYKIPEDAPQCDPPVETLMQAPTQCPCCNWSNSDLLNYGTFGNPNWLCHGCAARAIQAAKA